MKVLGAVLSVVLLHFVGCSDVPYQVPEPLIEVFSPRGLRVSVPDSKDVKSVEFFITVPSHPDALIHEANHTDGGYWIYWNPDVVVNLHDKLHYKLMIRHCELYWKKEGSHVVQKVVPLSGRSNDTDCKENQGQKVISVFPSLGSVEEKNKAMINTGKTTNFKSSYSMHKNSDLKPVTKSSTSTTSGTFYIKPSGVMEATGYKSGSTFDSTRREGEQWEHYQSQLTAEELENMRHLYGSGFYGFPHLNDKVFPNSAKIYEKSYMSSESKSFPGEIHKIAYGEGPMTTHQFHQTHKTHESSSLGHSQPVFQFHYGDSAAASNRQTEKLFRMEPLTHLPNPLPPQGTIVKTTEYVRQEHTLPAAEASQVHLERESHTSSTPQKIVQVSQSGEFSSHNQEIVKPVFTQVSGEYSTHNKEMVKPAYTQVSHSGEFSSHNQEIVKPVFTQVSHSEEFSSHNKEMVKPAYTQVSGEYSTHNKEIVKPVFTQVSQSGEFSTHNKEIVKPFSQVVSHSGRGDQLEYNSGNLQTIEKQNYRTRHYTGNIFTSVKTTKVKSPQECTLVPGLDYNSSGNVREIEKLLHELSCLATLAESTMKDEIALLKQKNAEYSRKMDQMEHEIKRFGSKCNCYE